MLATAMDVSELRKRILRALDEAKQEASSRRKTVDEAAKAYETFLTAIGGPVMRQAASVLKAAGHPFDVHTPAGSVRLASESSPQSFLELALDTSNAAGIVIGRVSVARGGRQGLIVEERPVAGDTPVGSLTEEDLAAFVVSEIPKLLVRS
jgi:hypothetical protein